MQVTKGIDNEKLIKNQLNYFQFSLNAFKDTLDG